VGKKDPQVFWLDLDITEPIPQITARATADEKTSPLEKNPLNSPPAAASPTEFKSDALSSAPAGQHIPKSPTRQDGDQTSISPKLIPIMMSLFAIPQLLMTLLIITIFSPPKLLIILVRIASTGYFLPYCYVAGAILRGKWIPRLAWAGMVFEMWLKD
jgi:hypothetical protein